MIQFAVLIETEITGLPNNGNLNYIRAKYRIFFCLESTYNFQRYHTFANKILITLSSTYLARKSFYDHKFQNTKICS